jgi:DNA-binding response OmpR family regulator
MQPHSHNPARPRVLIVDDDVALTKLLARVLSSENLDVDVIEEAREGLTIARERPPSLIIVDLHIRGTDGYEFIEACRAIAHCVDVPVLLVSGDGDLHAIKQRVQGEGVLVMPKPFDLETLIAAVHRAVRSHTVGHAPTCGVEQPRGGSPCCRR